MVKQVLEAVHFDTPFDQIVEELQNGNNVKENKQKEEDKATYQTLHHIRPSSYDDAGLLWLQINLHLSIHEQGRYLKYESYFTQTCMIFLFCVWPAECFHIQLFVLVRSYGS